MRNLLLLVTVAWCLNTTCGYLQGTEPVEPVLWYRLDETAGVIVNDGSAAQSGQASPGGLVSQGEPPLINDGGYAISFADGYVSPGSVRGVNRNPGSPWAQRTIELWFRADSLSGRQVLFEQGGSLRDLVLYLEDDTLYFSGDNRANDDGSGAAAPWGTPPVYVSVPGIAAGETYYVVAVLDATTVDLSGEMRVYLNGELEDRISGVGPIWQMNQVNLGMTRQGNRYHDSSTRNTGYPFYGVIDDFRLWNGVLGSETIRQRYSDLAFDNTQSSGLRIIQWIEIANP